MVYQQISAQTRSLHTDQNPISTISAPRLRPNPTTMAAQPHHFDASSERTFASTLRLHRLNQNLSLAVLAERVGCAKSYLSSIENGHKGPPADAIIEKLELALSFQFGELFECAQWDQTPMPIREDLEHLRERDETVSLLAKLLAQSAREGESLDKLYESGELRQLIDRIDPDQVSESVSQEGEDLKSPANRIAALGMLPMEVPLINKVTAGYPADFTDMGYPARIADEYVRAPDLSDPDAFAARVVGDSMEPNYREGDIVVFSPARKIVDGMDCFVRLERDDESTFKRIYFQKDDAGNEMIRIQPINNSYPPMTVPREAVAGLYAGVSVTRTI
ncbi:hypothetical protein COB72_03495 [bacterium]|nr:MAG: hypothetical protein COB72_03495 [bacterium]